MEEILEGDPAKKPLKILTLGQKGYTLNCSDDEKGKVNSPLLAGLKFDLGQILE